MNCLRADLLLVIFLSTFVETLTMSQKQILIFSAGLLCAKKPAYIRKVLYAFFGRSPVPDFVVEKLQPSSVKVK